MSKKETIEIRVPLVTIERLKKVAKLAGLSVNTICEVLIALHVYDALEKEQKD